MIQMKRTFKKILNLKPMFSLVTRRICILSCILKLLQSYTYLYFKIFTIFQNSER